MYPAGVLSNLHRDAQTKVKSGEEIQSAGGGHHGGAARGVPACQVFRYRQTIHRYFEPANVKMPRSEDFDSYLSALGVPYLAKKMAASSSPSLKVERDGEFWVVTFKAMMKTNEMRFEIGKQFTTKTPIGEEVTELLIYLV